VNHILKLVGPKSLTLAFQTGLDVFLWLGKH
jgi:hypothetical protein